MTSLRQKLIEYIRIHGQVHFRDIEKYAENNGYKAYTAVRRLQEVRDPQDPNYDPAIGTVEENGTIKFYVYLPSQKLEEAMPTFCCEVYKRSLEQHYKPWHSMGCKTRNLPRREELKPVPHTDYVPPVYEPKKKPQPYVWKAPIQCCEVAIFCQDKRLPVRHSQACKG
jgi:hypothetical protein